MASLREQVITAIQTKDRDQYEQLAKQITKEVGTWDRQGRYTINSEFATHTECRYSHTQQSMAKIGI